MIDTFFIALMILGFLFLITYGLIILSERFGIDITIITTSILLIVIGAVGWYFTK